LLVSLQQLRSSPMQQTHMTLPSRLCFISRLPTPSRFLARPQLLTRI
jgi:hypothetical protein